eukprot:TRINITY_DN469_c5_g1_i1.p1 TRINITY_DN469_c5_g1~~TRINITY_DN469_c5_g1_i1.p1  ORF type:complete len:237 (+),score=58.30 TRINITY_DN469_c5_g1_i1:98-712(+)
MEREASPWDSSDESEEGDKLPVIMVTKDGDGESFIRLKDSGWVASAYGSSTPKLSALADPEEVREIDLGESVKEEEEVLLVTSIKMDLLEVPLESFAMHTYELPSRVERDRYREERDKERLKEGSSTPVRLSPSPSSPPMRSPRSTPTSTRPSRGTVSPSALKPAVLHRPAPGAALHCVRRKKTADGYSSTPHERSRLHARRLW